MDLLPEPGEYSATELACPGHRAPCRRGLRTRSDLKEVPDYPRDKPWWSLSDAGDAIDALAAAGAAVSEGQIFRLHDGRLEGVARPSDRTGFPPIFTGPGTWSCHRAADETWSAFVERAAAFARTELNGLWNEPDPGALYVDLGWVTEDELALFKLPAYLQEAIDASIAAGRPPWGLLNVGSEWDGVRVRFAGTVAPCSFYFGRGRSLAETPRDASYLCVDGRAKDLNALAALTSLDVLRISPVTDTTLQLIAELEDLRVLELGDIRATGLAPLAGLRQLEVLSCGASATLKNLEILALLPRLRVLSIHLRALQDLTEIGRLQQLVGLHVGGGPEKPQLFSTLDPLAQLIRLNYLEIGNIRTADARLRPLASLTRLKHLGLPNRFPIEEFAELAAALPDAAGDHRSPFWIEPREEPSSADCKKCRKYVRGWTTGKPTKRLCPQCDAERLRAHVARWEILVSAARARVNGARR